MAGREYNWRVESKLGNALLHVELIGKFTQQEVEDICSEVITKKGGIWAALSAVEHAEHDYLLRTFVEK